MQEERGVWERKCVQMLKPPEIACRIGYFLDGIQVVIEVVLTIQHGFLGPVSKLYRIENCTRPWTAVGRQVMIGPRDAARQTRDGKRGKLPLVPVSNNPGSCFRNASVVLIHGLLKPVLVSWQQRARKREECRPPLQRDSTMGLLPIGLPSFHPTSVFLLRNHVRLIQAGICLAPLLFKSSSSSLRHSARKRAWRSIQAGRRGLDPPHFTRRHAKTTRDRLPYRLLPGRNTGRHRSCPDHTARLPVPYRKTL